MGPENLSKKNGGIHGKYCIKSKITIPVLGVVHVPVKSETYIGCKNYGAKKN
jgi:hypothetical protein